MHKMNFTNKKYSDKEVIKISMTESLEALVVNKMD